LFELGVVVVTTSNWPPDELYKDGLQRDNFLPFIDLIQTKLDVLHLDGGTDYRMTHLKNLQVFHGPLGVDATEALQDAFIKLSDDSIFEEVAFNVKGREIYLGQTAKGIACVDFAYMCEAARGAEDYITLAEHFHTFILDDVPILGPEKRNEAKRLMLFIDALYEHHCKLIMAADALPHLLYIQGAHAFEFERTVSRLMEMQSADYMEIPHRKA
jgi:cell division protein ZapE